LTRPVVCDAAAKMLLLARTAPPPARDSGSKLQLQSGLDRRVAGIDDGMGDGAPISDVAKIEPAELADLPLPAALSEMGGHAAAEHQKHDQDQVGDAKRSFDDAPGAKCEDDPQFSPSSYGARSFRSLRLFVALTAEDRFVLATLRLNRCAAAIVNAMGARERIAEGRR
jgi:hypothetical protein